MRLPLLASVLLVTACVDDGWHEGDPVDRAVTAWRMMPALDDTRVAISLEPRKIHRDEHGVITSGFATSVVGPSIAVEDDAAFASLGTGAGEVRVGATRNWLLQTDLTYWEHQTPSSSPPRTPFVLATLVDRATLAMTTVPLSPPIEIPALVGDTMFDVSPGGFSDIERDIVIRRREIDGSATTLHSGRGFASASCTRVGGVIVVYQQPSGDLHVVSVTDDSTVTQATLPGLHFDPLGFACNDAATHVAVMEATGATLIDVAAGMKLFHAPDLQPPMVISMAGTSMVAARGADRHLVYADAQGTKDLGIVSPKSPEPAVFTGDLAMFELETAVAVVDVARGVVGTTIPAIRDYMYPFEMKRWRDKFVVQLSTFDGATYTDMIEQMYVVDFTAATPLPLPESRYSPSLQLPGTSTLYVKGYDGTEDTALPHLTAIDLASGSVLSDELLPLCTDEVVLEERGCR